MFGYLSLPTELDMDASLLRLADSPKLTEADKLMADVGRKVQAALDAGENDYGVFLEACFGVKGRIIMSEGGTYCAVKTVVAERSGRSK